MIIVTDNTTRSGKVTRCKLVRRSGDSRITALARDRAVNSGYTPWRERVSAGQRKTALAA
jgi:hypothetical protein